MGHFLKRSKSVCVLCRTQHRCPPIQIVSWRQRQSTILWASLWPLYHRRLARGPAAAVSREVSVIQLFADSTRENLQDSVESMHVRSSWLTQAPSARPSLVDPITSVSFRFQFSL